MSSECLFCKIVRKQIPATLVSESQDTISFDDVNPQAPTHILVIPKKHIANSAQLNDNDGPLMSSLILEAVRIAKEKNLDKAGYRLVINCNADGGQTVSHLHIHILAGRKMKWPPG